MVKVSVPATSANLGPGFDVLGIALTLREDYQFEISDHRSIQFTGLEAEKLSDTPENYLHIVANKLENLTKRTLTFSALISRSIPLSMGLGSSAASIVGACMGLNQLFDLKLSIDDIFNLAVDIEGHPDNVSAALFGGLTISYKDQEKSKALKIKPNEDIKAFVFVPNYKLTTKKARSILSPEVKLTDAVFNLSRVAMLTHFFQVKSLVDVGDQFKVAFEDRLHQPQRLKLIPGFRELMEILFKQDILGAALSGAGPAVICFYDNGSEAALKRNIDIELKKSGLDYSVLELGVDIAGCIVR